MILCLGLDLRDSAGDPTPKTLTSGLVGLWRCEGDGGTGLVDSVGGHDGALSDDTMWGEPGVGGSVSCLLFDAANEQNVNIPVNAALDLHGAMSYMTWFKTSDDADAQSLIYASFDTGGSPLYCLRVVGLSNGTAQIEAEYWLAPATPNALTSNGVINTNNGWYHLAVTRTSNGAMILYINGIQDQTQAGAGAAFASPMTVMKFGSAGSFPGEYATGSMDNIRIYNRVLTAAEILAIYTGFL